MSVSIDFAELFKALPVAFVVLDRALTVVEANATYLRATGREHDDVVGRYVWDAFPESEERKQRFADSFVRAFAGEDSEVAMLPFAMVRADGTTEMRYWSCTHTPVRDGGGEIAYIVQHTQDVTGLVERQAGASRDTDLEGDVVRRAVRIEALSEALRAEGNYLKAMFRATPGFMAVLSGPNFVFELANDAYLTMVGRTDIIGKPIRDALPELAGQGFFEMLEDIYHSGEPFHGRGYPVTLQRRAGAPPEKIFVDFIWQPIRDGDGHVTSIFVQGSEVTDRVQATEQQRALLDEINHRVKNTLTTVQAMVQQTLKTAPSPEIFAESIQSRLSALSATHNLLTARNWSGAALRDLLALELEPHGAERIELHGPDTTLTIRRATNMGLVFHELATNAAKYGALSVPGGRVRVDWRYEKPPDGGFLIIDWIEQGGPPTREPTRRGFGSRLIERTIAAKPGASYTSTYRPEGLHWQVRLPPEGGGAR